MKKFDERTATAHELFNWCLEEYQSNNPIVHFLYANFFKRIEEIVGLLKESDKILEVGCGAGAAALRIRDMLQGQHFEASDVEARYMQKLKEMDFPLPVRQESVLQLDRQDREFDCVLLLEVLEHIEEYRCALAELFRVSRKYVVISVPNEPLWRMLNMARGKYLKDWGNTPGHINHWSVSKIKKVISQYGSVLKVYTPLPWIIVLAQVRSA